MMRRCGGRVEGIAAVGHLLLAGRGCVAGDRRYLRIARPGLDDTMLWSALETACLAETVRAMPQGLDTWIGDSGTRLSGGERKRLSIARALLADRPWLLLDEPSEGLDMATEARLCQRLALWLDAHDAGLLLVTHRPAMLALARDRYTLRPS
ncbi:MAG: ATP-binding cassette domain-containing protein [Sphingobium sp.]|nr:ATP-binding cassette domain-containing protein [Sphingobium sp.]